MLCLEDILLVPVVDVENTPLENLLVMDNDGNVYLEPT